MLIMTNKPTLQQDGTQRRSKTKITRPMLELRERQKAIDAMEFEIYEDEEEDGVRYVQFHEILFACVQRAYKKEDPSSIFSIDDQHKEVLRDKSKEVLVMTIKVSQYLMACRIVQAFRDHRFRKQLFATVSKRQFLIDTKTTLVMPIETSKEDPSSIFSTDDHHEEVLRDEHKEVLAIHEDDT